MMTLRSILHPHVPHFVTWTWSEQELTGLLVTLVLLMAMLLLS